MAAAVVAELAITSAPQVDWALLIRETTAEAPGMTTQRGVLPAVAAVAPEDQGAPAGQTKRSPVMAEPAY